MNTVDKTGTVVDLGGESAASSRVVFAQSDPSALARVSAEDAQAVLANTNLRIVMSPGVGRQER